MEMGFIIDSKMPGRRFLEGPWLGDDPLGVKPPKIRARRFNMVRPFQQKPWANRWEQALTQSLLTEDEQEEYFIEFMFADLLRGDLKTQMEAFQIAKQIGVFNPNEIRKKLNENPREGGDEYQETTPGAPPNQQSQSQSSGTAAYDQNIGVITDRILVVGLGKCHKMSKLLLPV